MSHIKTYLILLFLLLPSVAFSQSQRNPCVYGVGTNASATLTNGNCLAIGYYLAGVSGAPMPVGGIANASAPTFTEGLPGYLSFDLNGNLRVVTLGGGGTTTVVGNQSNTNSGVSASTTNLGTISYNYGWNGTTWDQVKSKAASTAAVATDTSIVTQLNPLSPGIIALGPTTPAASVPTVNAGFTYTHITIATTTAIKTGAGVLHTVCVNTLGTVASAITVDDALTATTPTIAVINSLTLLGCQTYDVAFTVGLTIVTTGTVAPDVTVSWR